MSLAVDCSFCLERFHDPRILPCGHTFCFRCLEKIVQTDGKKPKKNFACGLCRNEWQVPKEGLNALPKNYVAESLKDAVPNGATCVLAGNDNTHKEAEYFCIDCWDALCTSCSNGHKLTKFTQNHVLKRLKEVSRDDVEQHRKQLATKCVNHSNQDVVVYCTDCKEIACTICCVTRHTKHVCIELSNADEGFKKEINDALTSSKNAERDTKTEAVKLKITYDKLQLLRSTAITQTKSTISELRSKLTAACDVIQQRIDDVQKTVIRQIEQYNEEEFKKEFKDFDQHENSLAAHRALCESLLSSTSTVIDRAAQLTQVTKHEIKPLKSSLLQQNMEKQVKEISATASYTFVFKPVTYQAKSRSRIPSVSFRQSFKLNPSTDNFFVNLKPSVNKKYGRKAVRDKHNNGNSENTFSIHSYANKILCIFKDNIYLITCDKDTKYNVLNYTDHFSRDNVPENGLLINDEDILTSTTTTGQLNMINTTRGIISSQQINSPNGFFMVDNNNILVAAGEYGVYKSFDKGRNWADVFASETGQIFKVVQVKEGNNPELISYSFWVIEAATYNYVNEETFNGFINQRRYDNYAIQTTCFNYGRQPGKLCLSSYSSFTSTDIDYLNNLNRTVIDDSARVSLSSYLAYDGKDFVMMSDYHNHTIHLYSVSTRQYIGILPIQSPDQLRHPSGLHFDATQNLLLIGLAENESVDAYAYEIFKQDSDYHCFEISIKI